MRRSILLPLLFLTLAMVLVACSSSEDPTTTTTTVVDAGADDAAAEGPPDVAAMCRTLALYSAARVPPAAAAEALIAVDLEGATSQEMAEYGDLLIGAPAEECPEHYRYAEAIQYWLGF